MKTLLRLEELAQFLTCLMALVVQDVPWWVYLLLVLGPDISMLGSLVDARVGSVAYNLLHHKGVACLVLIIGVLLGEFYYISLPPTLDAGSWLIVGAVLYGHASMDRIFGYGLKFGDNFHHTHLGWIGKLRDRISHV